MSPRGLLALKAGGLFLVSLAAALSLGLGFSGLPPPQECGFSIGLAPTRGEEGFTAEVVWVEGTVRVDGTFYRALTRNGTFFEVLAEGPLGEPTPGTPMVTYLPAGGSDGLVGIGDMVVVNDPRVTDLLLLTDSGAPLGGTAGCT